MSSVRLYVDEDASETAVVEGLRGRGFDVLTTLEAGNAGANDAEQLEFATQSDRCIYTFNVGDFARLHQTFLQQQKEHAGIVVIPEQRYSIGEKIRQPRLSFIRRHPTKCAIVWSIFSRREVASHNRNLACASYAKLQATDFLYSRSDALCRKGSRCLHLAIHQLRLGG